MILLDSSTIISKELISIDEVFKYDDEKYAISVITYMEVLGYNFKSTQEKSFTEKFISFLTVVYIDREISNRVIELKKEKKMKLPDAIICATALLNDAMLITNDIRLKNIENLRVNILGIAD